MKALVARAEALFPKYLAAATHPLNREEEAVVYTPAAASAWLHTPHPLLLGVTPAAAAWHSDTLAQYAKGLLEPHD